MAQRVSFEERCRIEALAGEGSWSVAEIAVHVGRFEAAGVYGPKLTGGLCSRGGGYWLGNFAVVTGFGTPS